MSFALFALRAVLFSLSILFGLWGLEDGPYTVWIDSCLFLSIMMNLMLLLDVCTPDDEPGLHLASFGSAILAIICILHIYGS